MSLLPKLPKAPDGVTFGMSIRQSVLYNDLGFRGNRSIAFRRVYGIDYSPAYISCDNNAKSWDRSKDNNFNRQLCFELNPEVIAQKFISTTARTARQLVRIAMIVSSTMRWRKNHIKEDLLEDLNVFWDAYEDHMTCLYTFWNVESLLTSSLIDELVRMGFKDEVSAGLPSFVVPNEYNWFIHEQRDLANIKLRFSDSQTELHDAATHHANIFGFLSTPCNIGVAPSGADIIVRMNHIDIPDDNSYTAKRINDFPNNIFKLGILEQELSFWKHERLDAFALSDKYAKPMYNTLSDLLELPIDLMFFMTRDELTRAITNKRDIETDMLKLRMESYCLALINDSIDFYQPTTEVKKEQIIAKNGDIFKGMPTSYGKVQGRVRILPVGIRNPILSSDEIIVTNMTRPEIGSALDIALAYVTDEGGRLCHAAILSREKKKPCVVGLGNATQVLRSGMLIEVDGNNGTITVIDSTV